MYFFKGTDGRMVESFTDKQGSFLSPLVFDIYVVTDSILLSLLCCTASCTSCINYVIFRFTPPPRAVAVPLLYSDARQVAVKSEQVGRERVPRGSPQHLSVWPWPWLKKDRKRKLQ